MATQNSPAADTALVQSIVTQVGRRVVGQEYMVERLLIGLLTGGHVLLEGVPGLAKTLTVRTLAETINTTFQRIQFTPDLLPADVVGTQIYDQANGQFTVKKGPIFANIILADEINRAPAKVQAALLEAMQEKQVTIGGTTHRARGAVPRARDAEPDRAGRHVSAARGAGRPLHAQAARRLSDARRGEGDHAAHGGRRADSGRSTSRRRRQILDARRRIAELYMDERIVDYIVDIVHATREPGEAGLKDLAPLIEFGASPRATIALAQASRAHAFLRGRAFVTPDDVKAIAPDVLRHRVLTTYEAEAEEVTSDRSCSACSERSRVRDRAASVRSVSVAERQRRDRVHATRRCERPRAARRRRAARGPAAGQAARAAHARARELAVRRRVPLGVQGAGDGVRRGARVPARRRGAHRSTGT